jgi:magnesium transporter
MITYWQQLHEKLIRKKKEELDDTLNTWVDARSVTHEDITELQQKYSIEEEHILDILDPDELSRIEGSSNYVLIIARLPIFVSDAEIPYFTVPLGIILKNKLIITICWTDCEVLKDFSAGRIKNMSLADFPAFIIQVLNRADILFLRYLKEINRKSAGIQKELQVSIENKEIIQLLNLEKSLEFFTTSLNNNQLLLEKFRKTRLLQLDAEDLDQLDDVEIDNRQAIGMADTYSNILSGMMDAFASVISNNLNIVMKKLTIISLIMMVPTFVVSFFGMNIPLPFADRGWTGIVVISFLCILATVSARFMLRDRSALQSITAGERKNRGKKGFLRKKSGRAKNQKTDTGSIV